MARRAKKPLVLGVASLFGLGLAEGLSRLLFDPLDYLQPEIVQDDTLGHRIEPGSAGHDAWGYRNPAVPERVEIVAIGDSQTYGVAASADASWPAWLDRIRSEDVYNLALGGYGPVQYGHLLERHALELEPSTVIVGVYFGNDFLDAWYMAYAHEPWVGLRQPELIGSFAAEVEAMRRRKQVREQRLWGRVRAWFAKNSVVYRKLDFSPIGQWLHTAPRIVAQDGDPDHVWQEVNGTIVEFRPQQRLSAVDLDDPKIREGLRITELMLARMHARCVETGIRFVTTLIPTKERVFGDFLARNPDAAVREVVEEQLAHEDRARAALLSFLVERGIEVVDLLPALRAVAGEARIYPLHTEGHPNLHGYRLIAETLSSHLAADAGRTAPPPT